MEYIYSNIDQDVLSYHNTKSIFSKELEHKYHRHNAYEIYLFIGEEAKFYIEQDCYSLKKGDLVIVNPSELHRSNYMDGSEYESIGLNLKGRVINELSTSKTNLLECFNIYSPNKKRVVHLEKKQLNNFIESIKKITKANEIKNYGYEIIVSALLAQLLVSINILFKKQADSTRSIMPQIVQKTMIFIKENLPGDLSLLTLQKNLSYNGTYISCCFKKHTGLTLREYIIDQRIILAKELLSKGKTVQEVCIESGFNDYSNFIRTFSKVTGRSPGKYRQKDSF